MTMSSARVRCCGIFSRLRQMAEPRVDYLEADPVIPDQRYALISTVFPESMVEKRQMFYTTEFFKKVCEGLKLDEQKTQQLLGEFQTFKEQNQETLDSKFAEQNSNATAVFGLKIRGVYETLGEAKGKAASLQRRDPDFNIFLAETGKWLPLCSDLEYFVKNQEFLEPQLNELMRGYKENQQAKEEFFEAEKRQKVEAAIRDARLAREQLEKEQADNTEAGTSDGQAGEQAPSVDASSASADLVAGMAGDDPWLQRKQAKGKEPAH